MIGTYQKKSQTLKGALSNNDNVLRSYTHIRDLLCELL